MSEKKVICFKHITIIYYTRNSCGSRDIYFWDELLLKWINPIHFFGDNDLNDRNIWLLGRLGGTVG